MELFGWEWGESVVNGSLRQRGEKTKLIVACIIHLLRRHAPPRHVLRVARLLC